MSKRIKNAALITTAVLSLGIAALEAQNKITIEDINNLNIHKLKDINDLDIIAKDSVSSKILLEIAKKVANRDSIAENEINQDIYKISKLNSIGVRDSMKMRYSNFIILNLIENDNCSLDVLDILNGIHNLPKNYYRKMYMKALEIDPDSTITAKIAQKFSSTQINQMKNENKNPTDTIRLLPDIKELEKIYENQRKLEENLNKSIQNQNKNINSFQNSGTIKL